MVTTASSPIAGKTSRGFSPGTRLAPTRKVSSSSYSSSSVVLIGMIKVYEYDPSPRSIQSCAGTLNFLAIWV